jgi:hypothetical protein
MRIPITQVQAAAISALPQQASRETRATSSATAADGTQNELPIADKLEKSVETGDRDAQEQYQRPAHPPQKQETQEAQSPPGTAAEASSIWNLSVADDQPLPDLDIRG